MPIDIAGYASRGFRGPSLASIDRARTQNALGNLELQQQQNAVNRLPQANRAEDLKIQATEQEIEQQRRKNAGSYLARGFSSIARSATPKTTAQQFLQSPTFRQAAEAYGWTPDYIAQFSVAPTDTDKSIASSALDHARQLGTDDPDQAGIHSTIVGKNGNLWTVGRNGDMTDTGVKVSQFAPRAINLGEGQGTGILETQTGDVRRIVSPAESLAGSEAAKSAETIGKSLGEQYSNLQAAVVPAQNKITRLDRMSQILDGIETGKLTPATKFASEVLDSFGISVDPNLPRLQAAQSIANELALQNRNPSGGAGMPGAMSDADRQFLVNMGPNLSQTTAGRSMIVETARRLARREQEVAAFARQYRASHGGKFDEFFYDDLAKWSEAHPLFRDLPQQLPAAGEQGALPAGLPPLPPGATLDR